VQRDVALSLGGRQKLKSVGIIDYGSGNFGSVWGAVSRVAASVGRITRPEELQNYTHLVLPGVGSFGAAVQKLKSQELLDPISSLARAGEIPFLGICVGMQVLADSGSEFGNSAGMGVFSGEVKLLTSTRQEESLTLPHIGWNNIEPKPDSRLFADWGSDDFDFYFLHSYHVALSEIKYVSSTCFYGQEFISSLERGNTFGVQFHPEKSQINGSNLLQRFVEM
jgi:glutamine amidotransferase